MTLVRLLETNQPCELIRMIKYRVGDETRLLFAVRDPEGTVIACNGKQIERWSADVVNLRKESANV